ncbi:MAG: tetratricopeptide repeat protein [Myxococcaceae bacterium]
MFPVTMGKSLVERYEQMLAQDPTSSVFVELAKAMLERGEPRRAIAVCEAGLQHHPSSVVARVLWGKSLLMLQRPAEAMEQFDRAVAVDRDNPHAYNLIGEVLLHKGLYRSALPLLKKAVALQPNEARVRQWLEQTQAALAGGPAPDLTEATALDSANDASTVVETSPKRAESMTVPAAPSPVSTEEVPTTAAPSPLPPEPTTESARAPAGRSVEPPVLLDVPVSPRARDPVSTSSQELPAQSEQTPLGEAALEAGLLEDIPHAESEPAHSLLEMPKVEVSPQAAQAIAREYERELRDKLRETARREEQTFWPKHRVKIALGAVVSLALAVGVFAYLHTRSANQNRTLGEELARSRQLVSRDTPEDYAAAVESTTRALGMDDGSTESHALAAFSHAVLFDEHGGQVEHREQAMSALTRQGVREDFPSWTLLTEYHLSPPADRPKMRRRVIESKGEVAALHALAGQLLLEKSEEKSGIARLKKALELDAKNVRALVAIADYYRRHDDHMHALELYGGTAVKLAPTHPGRVIGAAESRLYLQKDLAVSRSELEKLNTTLLTPRWQSARALTLGRLLAATGDAKAGRELLAEAAENAPEMRFEFSLALAEAARKGGDWETALLSAETALRLRPASDEAKEAMGLALLARDRPKDVVARLIPGAGDRRVRLVRAQAFAVMKDWKRVRSELIPTQVAGKYPSEAVVFLALADAAEGQAERAQQVLEKTLASTRRARTESALALGRIYAQRGLVDKARAQFGEAAKDPEDYEGACELGRLLAKMGSTDGAQKALGQSVRRNGFHEESRAALAQTELQLGHITEAVAQAAAWVKSSPNRAEAHHLLARAYLLSGQVREADAQVLRALQLDPDDARILRTQAQVAFGRGDGRTAMAALAKSNRLDSRDAETSCEIGRAYMRQGNVAGANKAFQAALRQSPDAACARVGDKWTAAPQRTDLAALEPLASGASQIWDRALAKVVMSRVMAQGGSKQGLGEARRLADEGLQLAPWLGEAHYQVGTLAARAKDDERARQALEFAVRWEPTDARFRLAFADQLARMPGQAPRAASEYEAFLRLGGTLPDAGRVRRMLPLLKKRGAAGTP